jgi:hypothetical protein
MADSVWPASRAWFFSFLAGYRGNGSWPGFEKSESHIATLIYWRFGTPVRLEFNTYGRKQMSPDPRSSELGELIMDISRYLFSEPSRKKFW